MVATLWVAVLVWVARMAAIYGGSWLGAWLGGTPSEHRLRVWQGMVTQVHILFTSALACKSASSWQACFMEVGAVAIMQFPCSSPRNTIVGSTAS